MKKSILLLVSAGVVLITLILILVLGMSKPQPSIGICYRDNTAAENTALRTRLEQLLKEQGYEVLVLDADADQARQLEQIAQLQKRKCSALLVEPVMSSAAGELLQVLDSTGIPAVLFNRPVDAELLQQHPNIPWVGADAEEPGKLQARLADSLPNGADLNGDGTVSYMVLQGPEDHIDTAVGLTALENALTESAFSHERISLQYGDCTREEGRRLCKQELAAYGKDIEVIFCGSELMALGAAEAIADGGRTVDSDIYLLTAGADKAPVEQGSFTAMAYLDPVQLAQTIADVLTARLNGQALQQRTVLPYTQITG